MLGGLAGLSGPLPTLWASLRGWGKDQRRGVFQAFNLTILSVALFSFAMVGLLTPKLLAASLAALPATFLGAWAGRRLYDRLDDRQFHRTVLLVLLLSGCVLTVTALR